MRGRLSKGATSTAASALDSETHQLVRRADTHSHQTDSFTVALPKTRHAPSHPQIAAAAHLVRSPPTASAPWHAPRNQAVRNKPRGTGVLNEPTNISEADRRGGRGHDHGTAARTRCAGGLRPDAAARHRLRATRAEGARTGAAAGVQLHGHFPPGPTDAGWLSDAWRLRRYGRLSRTAGHDHPDPGERDRVRACFDPDGQTLYVNQYGARSAADTAPDLPFGRAGQGGVTYAIFGPFEKRLGDRSRNLQPAR